MREIKLRRRTVQSYGNISRFSEVRWGILPIVSSELFGPAIYVFSIEQILGDLPKMSQLPPSFIKRNLWKNFSALDEKTGFLPPAIYGD